MGEGHDRQILGNEGVVGMGMIKIHHTHAWYFQGIMKRHPKKGSTFFFSLVSEVDFKVFQHGSLSPSLGLPSPLFLSQVFFFLNLFNLENIPNLPISSIESQLPLDLAYDRLTMLPTQSSGILLCCWLFVVFLVFH